MKYCYGPVLSRRLGLSLGIDLTPKKICTHDCIYCQIQKTSRKTIRRAFYVNLPLLKRELIHATKHAPRIDYLTLSGSGEPTLHSHLDTVIRVIKETTQKKYPLCVITNSSLLYRAQVRKELSEADIIIPSLDAASDALFKKVNKPHASINIQKTIAGIKSLRKEFTGQIWLEVMLLAGINDSRSHLKKLKKLIQEINPHKVQLNLPIRSVKFSQNLLSMRKLTQIKKYLGKTAEIASNPLLRLKQNRKVVDEKDLLSVLSRRPSAISDLSSSLGKSPCLIRKTMQKLEKKGMVTYSCSQKKVLYSLARHE